MKLSLMVFIGGGKRAKEKDSSDSEDERRKKEAKKSREEIREHDLKMAAIMEKYCKAPQARSQGCHVALYGSPSAS